LSRCILNKANALARGRGYEAACRRPSGVWDIL
jgi:hypothetical protein